MGVSVGERVQSRVRNCSEVDAIVRCIQKIRTRDRCCSTDNPGIIDVFQPIFQGYRLFHNFDRTSFGQNGYLLDE